MSTRDLLRRRRTWVIGVPLLIVLVVVGGTWLYLNVLRDDPPDRLSLADVTTTTAQPDATSTSGGGSDLAAEGIDGTWQVTEGSQAGYRVPETLFGQDAEAVGRTEQVSGSLEAAGTTIAVTEVEVDMASVTSDESRRDGQFRDRIMSTDEFPTATFLLSSPIELGSLPGDGEELDVTAQGELTLRGVSRAVEVPLVAALDGDRIVVSGSIPIDFDEFGIPDASFGPASVGRAGELELLLVFER